MREADGPGGGMTAALLALALSAMAPAAIDGVLLNRTSGRPASGVEVRLLRMSAAGSEAVQTVKTDAQGRFVFQQTPEAVHYLLEAQHQGVAYTQMLAPGAAQQSVELAIYDVVRTTDAARLIQRIVFLEPDSERLNVNETWLFRNDGRVTWYDPQAGALRFFLPEAAGENVTVMVTAPGGMPVPRSARKTGRRGLFFVDFPIKPGETRFDVSYTLPTPQAFTGRVERPEVPTRLVVPTGVTLKGEGLESLGQDPSLRAAIFEIKGRREFAVEISGSGSLRGAVEEDAGPSIESIPPRVYDSLPWILGPTIAALILGFVLLYRSSPAIPTAGGRR